jgi:hypothetical protein
MYPDQGSAWSYGHPALLFLQFLKPTYILRAHLLFLEANVAFTMDIPMAMIEFANNDQSSAMQLQEKWTIALHANSLPRVSWQFCQLPSSV